VIDQIMALPEDVSLDDLGWIKQLDIDPYKKALAKVRKQIPDFSPGPKDLGSFEYFEQWRTRLPVDFDSWEDALPSDFSELGPSIEETSLGLRLKKSLEGKSFFDHIQDSAQSLSDTLDALKA
jgi:hypothetical protein